MDLLTYVLCLTIAVKTDSLYKGWFWFYAGAGVAYAVARLFYSLFGLL